MECWPNSQRRMGKGGRKGGKWGIFAHLRQRRRLPPSIKGSEWGDPSFLRPPSKHLPMHCQRPKSGIRARVREVLGRLAGLSLPPSLPPPSPGGAYTCYVHLRWVVTRYGSPKYRESHQGMILTSTYSHGKLMMLQVGGSLLK